MKTLSFFLCLFCSVLMYAQTEIQLYPGAAPGSEDWDWAEAEYLQGEASRCVYNISTPTLTIFAPEKENSTGTAVIICPGGGFQFLSIDSEGYEVARWLNTKGITAFVLKYRVAHSLTDNPVMEFMKKQPNSEKFNKAIEPIVAMAISDGKEAIAHVRRNAATYGINPDQIGLMGFSAGGTLAAGVAYTFETENRPDFAAPIYPYVGSFGEHPVPDEAPPLFILGASDDFFGFQSHCISLYSDWIDAGKPAELHLYEKGGHGFGMNQKGLPVDNWIERFYEWLLQQG